MTAHVSQADVDHLERARQLARRGWGRVHPNPMVGCVLVRDGRVVAEGYHREFGGPHAEVVALESARSLARGATAYVSLEPCNHEGKTPPCAQALVAAGVRRVVYGVADPGVESSGGADTLRRAGVEVTGPVWSPLEGRAENPAFFHAAHGESPWVALKLALTLDGCVAAAPGVRTRITGQEAEREVHRLRSGFDAVMVGAGTARIDDPRLTVRLAPAGRVVPRRIVLDSEGSLPSTAALLEEAAQIPVHVFTRKGAPEEHVARLEGAGAHVHAVPVSAGGGGGLDLGAVLAACREMGVGSILCEGGPRLAASLLGEGRAHRLYLFLAPFTLGASGVRAFPPDADAFDWRSFLPVLAPVLHGRDTLIVLDRGETP
ncbi:MAG: bifunctional diaminohydroxyphosphoribosylaminopyrimidine deaminase/5-amino-6-(5-phosphoribosylamino)uracil reductase RibD [Gemmatimonadetes bacterium]|nr:bifunctional diaminohydroxyphosphoribosylaminopyrimidine deaminase/5-amino-6-(5-phosphoribosylamino)uracil reductase RibD [Gemmatimonadota bacterium]